VDYLFLVILWGGEGDGSCGFWNICVFSDQIYSVSSCVCIYDCGFVCACACTCALI